MNKEYHLNEEEVSILTQISNRIKLHQVKLADYRERRKTARIYMEREVIEELKFIYEDLKTTVEDFSLYRRMEAMDKEKLKGTSGGIAD